MKLSSADFYKSMESVNAPGRWQDVYRPVYRGRAIYLKLQIVRTDSSSDSLIVISFKRL